MKKTSNTKQKSLLNRIKSSKYTKPILAGTAAAIGAGLLGVAVHNRLKKNRSKDEGTNTEYPPVPNIALNGVPLNDDCCRQTVERLSKMNKRDLQKCVSDKRKIQKDLDKISKKITLLEQEKAKEIAENKRLVDQINACNNEIKRLTKETKK